MPPLPKPFKMKKKQAAKVEVKRKKDLLDNTQEEVLTQIQGQDPGSPQEWRFAMALDILKIRYWYQVDVLQPSGIRGGQRLDFLIETVPLPTPVYMQSYWHLGDYAAESKYKIAALMAQYRGVYAQPVEVDGKQINTVQDALDYIQLHPELIP